MNNSQYDYIKMGPTDCWPWSGLADEAPNIDAVMACRNPQCCNPRHFVMPAVKPGKPVKTDGSEASTQEEGPAPDRGQDNPPPSPQTDKKRRGRPPRAK